MKLDEIDYIICPCGYHNPTEELGLDTPIGHGKRTKLLCKKCKNAVAYLKFDGVVE